MSLNHTRSRFQRLRTLAAALIAIGALGALGTTTPAAAVTINWGPHGPARLAAANPLDYFIDTYSFSVGAGSWRVASSAVSSEVSIGGSAVYSIIGGSYGLYANPDGIVENGDETAIGAGLSNFDGSTGAWSSMATIGQGSYYYLVTGLAFGSAGGAYQLASAVALVPEPASIALWLAGAAAFGAIAVRRRHRPTRGV